MNVAQSSAWGADEISRYLDGQMIPVRLAVADGDFPLICSLWFLWDAENKKLKCASHENTYLVSLIKTAPQCGFEVAADKPPYRGVRGKAKIQLVRSGAGELLEQLIAKYLGDKRTSLSEWLLGRADEEYVIELDPIWMTSWDYSERMSKT